jgi:hypothetical protein
LGGDASRRTRTNDRGVDHMPVAAKKKAKKAGKKKATKKKATKKKKK